jgi:peptide/nickel transport system permease protein
VTATFTPRGRLQVGAGLAVAVGIALCATISVILSFGGGEAGGAPLMEPGAAHWLGTDQTGRDVVSALMTATLTSLLVAWFAALVSLAIGIPAGIVLASRLGAGNGPRSMVAMLPVAICLGVVLTALAFQSTLAVFIAIGIPGVVAVARATRAIVAPPLGTDYFSAARLAGLGWLGSAQRHIVPMVMPLLIAMGLEWLAVALLVEVTLSFAGLGVAGDGFSLGTMLREDWPVASMRPLLVIVPGVVAVVVPLALLIAADGLRSSREWGRDGAA